MTKNGEKLPRIKVTAPQIWGVLTKHTLLSHPCYPSDMLHKPVSSNLVASSTLPVPPPPFLEEGPREKQ